MQGMVHALYHQDKLFTQSELALQSNSDLNDYESCTHVKSAIDKAHKCDCEYFSFTKVYTTSVIYKNITTNIVSNFKKDYFLLVKVNSSNYYHLFTSRPPPVLI
ncbi:MULTISPECIES: hypothetical protein [Myroides]|uniref:hypothetical protein n=1 Tax=Myroides TaxID=76831 RepID=UPI001E474EF5|nr:hypothetical protein [Myroides phaeus]